MVGKTVEWSAKRWNHSAKRSCAVVGKAPCDQRQLVIGGPLICQNILAANQMRCSPQPVSVLTTLPFRRSLYRFADHSTVLANDSTVSPNDSTVLPNDSTVSPITLTFRRMTQPFRRPLYRFADRSTVSLIALPFCRSLNRFAE